jgi:hypothetical protein
MYKKIAGVGLSVLLASTIVYAGPETFSDDSNVNLSNSASESSLETADITVSEDSSSQESKDYEKWVADGNSSSDDKDEKATTSDDSKKDESTKAEESEKTEEKKEIKTTEYTVVSGDCLSAIAGKLLGDMSRWPEIVELNKDKYPSLVSNPNLILVGWNLTIPGKEGSSTKESEKDSDKDSIARTPTDSNSNSGNNNSNVASDNNSSNNDNKSASNNNNNNKSDSSSSSSNSSNSGGPIITPDSRVLHIGDSHSVGVYGHAIDDLMRQTGASVSTTAVAGSNPTWFMNGTVGKCGYYSKDENGKVVSPSDWRTPMQTPLLQNMIDTYKPSVLVVSLGANMVGYSESSIRSQIDSICDKAKAAGCKIVWVGPPDSRSQDKNQVAKLYNVLNSEVGKYDGVVVDSRQYTKYPSSGGDGLHYSGNEGTQTAKNWANSVMNAIQGK